MIFDYNNIPDNTKSFNVLDYKEIQGKKGEDVDLANKNLYKEMEILGWQMTKTCVEQQGIGLAAPQIGQFVNVFITVGFTKSNIWGFDNNFHMFINPAFKKARNTEEAYFPEGCLSVPEEQFFILRPREINVEYWYFDKNKKLKKNMDRLDGFSSRVFLHEFDHLLGTNIVETYQKQNKIKMRKK